MAIAPARSLTHMSETSRPLGASCPRLLLKYQPSPGDQVAPPSPADQVAPSPGDQVALALSEGEC
jgi:hypothetical protein